MPCPRNLQMFLMTTVTLLGVTTADVGERKGYYPFEEAMGYGIAPNPPTVRKPPYAQTDKICFQSSQHHHLHSLCGDLNDGFLPINPMGQNVGGQSYPFQILRNKTLEFLSGSLASLENDSKVPKVARFQGQLVDMVPPRRRKRRSEKGAKRDGRAICETSDGIICKFLSTLFPKRDGEGVGADTIERQGDSGPSTPCPSRVHYAAPVFAKNYQGLWRYVVQIPDEGYLTQNVEVTTCTQGKCDFLDGRCLSSPRWVSMLVAEIFYPNSYFPTTSLRPDGHPLLGTPRNRRRTEEFKLYADEHKDDMDLNCDGRDHIGCYQVRIFYDWFLVPGACKCWITTSS